MRYEFAPSNDAFRASEFMALLQLPIWPVGTYRGSGTGVTVNPSIFAEAPRTRDMWDKVQAVGGLKVTFWTALAVPLAVCFVYRL